VIDNLVVLVLLGIGAMWFLGEVIAHGPVVVLWVFAGLGGLVAGLFLLALVVSFLPRKQHEKKDLT
jgi:hypothetical protein